MRIAAAIFMPLLGVVNALFAAPVTQEAGRPYRIADSFAEESLGSTVFAPDGQALVFTRRRPMQSMPQWNDQWIKEVLDDVWLQEAPGRPARNLTNGSADHSGWWAPSWSPDGTRLAMLSSRGGTVALWVWERASGQLRQVGGQDMDFEGSPAFQWVDERRIVGLAPPAGERSTPLSAQGRAVERAQANWAEQRAGRYAASVSTSNEFTYAPRAVILFDVESGTSTPLATTTIASVKGRSWWLAPDGQTIAVLKPATVTHNWRSRMRMSNPFPVALYALDGRELILHTPLPGQVLTPTLQWSPDGRELAFFAYGDAPINPLVLHGRAAAGAMPEYAKNPTLTLANPARLYRVALSRQTVEEWPTGEIDLGYLGAPQFSYTAQNELVFHAPRRTYGMVELSQVNSMSPGFPRDTHMGPHAPRLWWVLARDGHARLLSGGSTSLPASLQPIDGGTALLGTSAGNVWRIDTGTGAIRNLTQSIGSPVTSLAALGESRGRVSHLILASGELSRFHQQLIENRHGSYRRISHDTYRVLDLESGKAQLLQKPSPGAALVEFNASSNSAVFLETNHGGTFLWRSTGTQKAQPLLEINTFVKGIAKSACRRIEYRTLNWEQGHGTLCPPPGYRKGQRVPLVITARVGGMERDKNMVGMPILRTELQQANIFNSLGFAYFVAGYLPSNYPGLEEEEGQDMLMAPNGVLPGVDQVIEMGIADPARIFISGASHNARSALWLLAQTSRFRAADIMVAPVGSTLLTGSGSPLQAGMARRLSAVPHDWVGSTFLFKQYDPSEIPFWRDGDRIRRFDPLTYVQRIQTPVLITAGELDPCCDLEGSEQYFNALVALRKPAQLVRYWGAGHGWWAPSYVRDRWQRVFAWFDDWGDIARDARGHILYDADGTVRSRNNTPPLKPEDYVRFDVFGPSGVAN